MALETASSPRRIKEAAGLALAAAAFFFWDLGGELPDQTAEARVPVSARNMVRAGLTAIPQLGQEPWHNKPPLAIWLQSLSMRLGGENLTAAGLPAAALSLAAVLAVAWRGGLVAGLILLLCPRFFLSARGTEMDIVYSSLTALAIFRGFSEIERRGRVSWASQLLLGLALTAKTPLCLVFALFAWHRGWLSLWMPLSLLPGLGWWLWATVEDPAITRRLVGQMLKSTVVPHETHKGPIYDYVAGFFPLAAPAVIPVVFWALEKLIQRRRKVNPVEAVSSSEGDASPAAGEIRRLLFWFLGGLAVLSLMTHKQTSYALPIYPPFALLAARAVDRLGGSRTFFWASRFLSAALFAPAAILLWQERSVSWRPALGIAAAALGGVWVWRASPGAVYRRLLLALIPVLVLGALPLIQDFKRARSLVPIGRAFREHLQKNDPAPFAVAILGGSWEEITWGFGEDLPIARSLEEAKRRRARYLIREVDREKRSAPADSLPVAVEFENTRHKGRWLQLIKI
ncbi:MAG: glycosyltransferase family 39 protein [Planctomycetes bacterium]|nr:glycosyltransferase family 39 protein [Planctomycetota bacterium]